MTNQFAVHADAGTAPAGAALVNYSSGLAFGHATIRSATHAQMVRSKLNVRRKNAGKMEELVALLRAHGLLQNLVGFDQVRAGRPTGMVEIVAGGRRLEAAGILIAAGDWPADFQIPFLLVSEEEAVALSLSENLGREPMHPADVFDCMRDLARRGASADDIGIAFGVDALTVKRRLKLANVSPRLFAMYRNDELNGEQMIALAVSYDHAAQEQAWDSLDPWSRKQPHNIRRLLTAQQVNIRSDRVARFVGAAAFERAGGVVARDLFSDEGDGYIGDAALLDRLAAAKLEQAAVKLREEGLAWVDIVVRSDPAALADYGKVRSARMAPNEQQGATLAALDEQLRKRAATLEEVEPADATRATSGDEEKEDEEAWDEEAGDEGRENERGAADCRADADGVDFAVLSERRRVLERERAALEHDLIRPVAADVALAGALVTLDHAGQIVVHRGLIRPGDRSKMVKLAGPDGATGGATRRVRAVHSERLVQILSSHRTAALAAELMRRPDVALAALTHALVKSVFFPGECGERVAGISLTAPVLAEEVRASAAAQALASRHAAFAALVRADHDERSLFDWLLAQQQGTLLELLAFCTAHALDTAPSGEARSPAFLDMARALSLDINNWWRPTAANYFQYVSKERIVDVVAQAVSTDVAAPMAKMKKPEAADAAERALAPHRWLPDALQTS